MKFEISPKLTETILNWQDAISYCSTLDINGFGWRLPNTDELKEIYLMENDFEKSYYWTSIEVNDSYYWASDENNGCCAWIHNFYNGNPVNYINMKSSIYVRAIRDL